MLDNSSKRGAGTEGEGESLKWKHTYFFFRGLRHIQYLNGRGALSLFYRDDPELKTIEAQAVKIINEVIQRHGFIKSYQILKVVELAMLCKFDSVQSQLIWKTLEDQLLYNSEYETLRDVLEVLETVKEGVHFQRNENFWKRMMEKIIAMRNQFTTRDIIDIIETYTFGTNHLEPEKAQELTRYIKTHSKSYIVEEIDSLGVKEILTLIELFGEDREFKKFLAYNLKEKLVKSANLPLRDLMTIIVETLDIEELRGEIVRYSLNSEAFYAFPVSYMISLLKKISVTVPL